MAITENNTAFVDTAAVSIGLSQMFTVTAAANNPPFLVLTALDRDEYTAGASQATGRLSGNGHSIGFVGTGDDARGAGIVFTYQASTGRYYSSTYGYLDQLVYTASGSLGDVTSLSLFGAADLAQAAADASDVYGLMQVDAAGYLGSATVVTRPAFTGPVPAQATPDSIAAIADSFVGQAWNMNGCWVLASTIAAEAGASLPVQSALTGQAGQSNGEWFVAFNGAAGQSGNWQSMVRAGEMVVIGTPGGGGHITTCVSGSGGSAMLVDNITYENGAGGIQNAANDGSASDVIVSAPHAASQEWSGVQASSVVIYELDTPIVTAAVASDSLRSLGSAALASLFTAIDPAGKGIVQWQVYDTATSDSLAVNGTIVRDHAAASAVTAASLSGISLLAGSSATTDTLEVRAFNGSYWGDWTSLGISIVAAGPALPTAPVLAEQTAGQTWKGGTAIALTLPGASFVDPQGEALTYTATLANGGALPGWLTFNGTTRSFSGSAPTTPQAISLAVTATDTSGLSATDTFAVTVLGLPVVTSATANQTWTEGEAIVFTLARNTFSDPQGQSMSYHATLSNGQALPDWLRFDPLSETFSGTAPSTTQSLGITVTATDSSGLSATETFAANVKSPPVTPTPVPSTPVPSTPGPSPTLQPAMPFVRPGVSVTAQTANQSWTDGQSIDVVLPSSTFTDALGLKMTFRAYELSGPNVTSWLRFNATAGDFYGSVPAAASGTARIEVSATDAWGMAAADLFTVTLVAATGHKTSAPGGGRAGSTGQMSLSEPTAIVFGHG